MTECNWLLIPLLLTALLVSVERCLVSAQGCEEGQSFLPDGEQQCVSECPCGFSSDENHICSNENNRAFFNHYSQSVTVPVSTEPQSYITTMMLSIRNDSFLGDLRLSFRFKTLTAYYMDSYTYPLYFNSASIKFRIGGTTFYLNQQSSVLLPEAMLTLCNGTSAEYIQVPVEAYFLDDVGFLGRNEFYLTVKIGIGTSYQTTAFANLNVIVETVCQTKEYYVPSTGQCVSQCPCGTKSISFYCDESIPEMELDPVFQIFDIDSTTTGGSVVSTLNLYYNITPGSHISTILFPVVSMSVFPYSITHNDESDVDYYDIFKNFHYYLPDFNLKMNGENASNPIRFNGSDSVTTMFPVSNPGVERCTWGNSTFLRVQVEMRLASPYFYHLGQYSIEVYVQLNNVTYYYYASSTVIINVNTDTECDLAEHYNFDSGGCVGECPCGFIGFDNHNPHYCEPAIYDPGFSYLLYYYFIYFEAPAKFSETAYKVSFLWDSPPREISFQSKINVLLDHFYGNNIMAHVKVLYTGSTYATGPGYGTDVPGVTLTGPIVSNDQNLTLNAMGKEVDLVLRNSSLYGMEYCTNDLQDEVFGYLSVTVTVFSPPQYSHIANHSFVLQMTFEDIESSNLLFVEDSTDFTIFVEEGDIGQTPRPATVQPVIEGIDYYPFVNLKYYHHSELQRTSDGASEPVLISVGLPFGNSIQTQAYVGVNGIISFDREWPFSSPSRFPTASYLTREGFVVAPFWNDHDLRKSGAVRYAVFEVAEGGIRHELLPNISAFIRGKNEQAEVSGFEGVWMLVAHWDQVHPYPHGSSDTYYQLNYGDFIEKQNSYQAIIITDGADSYALFTYNCDQMEWTGYWQHGVVGYSARGDYYDNHPAAGFEVVGTAVACASDLYGSPWNNIVYKISLTPQFRMNARRECIKRVMVDEERIPDPSAAAALLEPCPCSLDQARRDWGRFTELRNKPLCFVQSFPVEIELAEGNASFTQECCYAPQGTEGAGSLIINGQYPGSMLSYHPLIDYNKFVEYDELMRDNCCGVADMCSRFFLQRPINDCTGYEPPVLTWGIGDPHITTLDGRSYTFNGWGEYVLLEYTHQKDTSPQFVVQGRTVSVNESRSDAATQFSAFAFGIPGQLTFQVGQNEGYLYVYSTVEGVVENISNHLLNVSDMYNNTAGRAVLTRQGEDSILAVFANGVGIVINVTAGIPNFVLSLPPSFRSQTRGLLGNYNDDNTDDFIPRNQSSALPDTISDKAIHEMFGQSWAIDNSESLFSYSLEGKAFQDYQFPNHTPVFADQLVVGDEQKKVCGSSLQCLYDYSQTGSMEVGLATTKLDEMNTQDQLLLANYPPNITGDSVFRVTVAQQSQYVFTVVDPGDTFSVGIVGGLPSSANLVDMGQGVYAFQWTLQKPTNMSLTFFATDSLNTSSTLSPRVEVCACMNGGVCTLDGLLVTDASTVTMVCNCTSAFDGLFCEEDRDGCMDVACYKGVECLDVPAPGVGAKCGACPAGFTGDGSKCLDMNECVVSPAICKQFCVNTEGSYICNCWQGYKMDQDGECEDVNECSGLHDCQQECINSPGSYSCDCREGFELAADNKSCTALAHCSVNSCTHTCTLVDGVPKCDCYVGYELASGSDENCVDKDECELYSPCNQECTNLPGSFECSCAEGYELRDDGITCTDIDECLQGALYGIELCTNNTTCVNSEGGYECVCSPGYTLMDYSCQRDQEVPPLVLQIIPVNAVNNRMRVTIDGLTFPLFTSDRRQEFKVVAAVLVTEYCSAADCLMVANRRRRQSVMVEAKHVALQNVGEDSEGRLTFFVYVELEEGILALEVIQNALQGNEQPFVDGVAGVTAINFDVVVIPSASSTSPAQSTISVSSSPPLPISSPAPSMTSTSAWLDSVQLGHSQTVSTASSAQSTISESSSSPPFLVSMAVSTTSSSSSSARSGLSQVDLSQTQAIAQSSSITPINSVSHWQFIAVLSGVIVSFLLISIVVLFICILCIVVLRKQSQKKQELLMLDTDSNLCSISPMHIPSDELKAPVPDEKDSSFVTET